MEKKEELRKPARAFGVLFNLALLFYFKYLGFFLDNVSAISGMTLSAKDILMPIGISFFTFQQIGFIADTYRGETKEYGFTDYCLFVCFKNKFFMHAYNEK